MAWAVVRFESRPLLGSNFHIVVPDANYAYESVFPLVKS
jgi:hypothetical protein